MTHNLQQLREYAEGYIAGRWSRVDDTKAVLQAFLDLTDPTPLQPNDCPANWDRDDVFSTVTVPSGGIQFDYHGSQRYLTVCEATRGQLAHAIAAEKARGE